MKRWFKRQYNLKCTHGVATEGIFFARGEAMEKSTNGCDREKLLDWCVHRLPNLLLSQQTQERAQLEKSETLAGKARFRLVETEANPGIQRLTARQQIDSMLETAEKEPQVRKKLQKSIDAL